jgi:short-subunit dehydrogenase
MRALVTGASSGIGRDIARHLSSLGYDLVVVARRRERLEELKNELKSDVQVLVADLSKVSNCIEVFEKTKQMDIDILVNSAGFGVYGEFISTDLFRELNMIDVNVKCTHVLTKLFLNEMRKKDKGFILNVASSAGFAAGPFLSSYYASKAYIIRLTEAIHEELGKSKSKVVVSLLCPGPVDTEFGDVAGMRFLFKPASSKYIAEYGVKHLFKKRLIIVPTLLMKLSMLMIKILPASIIVMFNYRVQKKMAKF